MTPLAARLFRIVQGPLAEQTQRELAGSQFFECTQLANMAIDMRWADGLASGYSEMAQLPAPRTVLEAVLDGRRMMFCCSLQSDGYVAINCITEIGMAHTILWQAAFLPGSTKYRIVSEAELSDRESRAIIIGTFLVEKFLCIINQPGLVERQPRDTDKRVRRTATASKIGDVAPTWHECRIRPGSHVGSSDAESGEGREHQLHYVRKYFKPSIQKWVEGYWRGNADLGIHLKWYSAAVPAVAA